MHTIAFRDEKLGAILTFEPDRLWLSLKDLRRGAEWQKIPLLEAEIYSKAEFRAETIRKFRIDLIRKTNRGVHIVVGDESRHIRIGLWLNIIGGELEVRLPVEEVREGKPATHRLFSVIVFPGLLSVGPHGRLLLPVNTGVVCTPKDKPRLADRFMIYGEQSRWELLPMLPVCAAQDARGGLMALAVSGAAETECHVATDGRGGGSVGFGLSFRQFWPDPVEKEIRVIRYIPVPAGADMVHFAAKRLRRHVMEDLGKPTIEARAKESPEVAGLLDSYIMKLFYAVQTRGLMMQGRIPDDRVVFKQVMNFAEAGVKLKALHKAGITRIITQSVGWNPRGHDGLWPSRFPIEKRLGGEAGFRSLIATGKALGYQMNVHDNYLSAYRASPDFKEDRVIHDQWGEPMGLGEWGGGTTYILNALALPDRSVAGQMRKVKALGLTGAAYLDGMGNPLYRDYHPVHRMTRSGYARGVNRLIEAARNVYGAAGTECGFMYCAVPADSMVTAGEEWHLKRCWKEWPVTHLLDRRVPLWQLALHGLIILESHGIYWSGIMECILFGKHPRDEWSAHPGVMPVLDATRIRILKAGYDLCLTRFGHLQARELLTYEEPAENVRRTTFAGDIEVIADFGRQELIVDGKKIPRPAET